MEHILYDAKFTVTDVIDCSKEYDNVSRVVMKNESTGSCKLDVHNKLYTKILKVGVTVQLTLCTGLKISEETQVHADDPVYNSQISNNLQKAVEGIDYAMHGTAFDFKEDGEQLAMTVSFGGLLLTLSEVPEVLVRFKHG